MKVDNVGISEEYWKDKTFDEFQKAMKGKLRSDKIKGAWSKLPKVSKPIKAKEVKKEISK